MVAEYSLMPSLPPLPQKGPYLALLFRQNSLTSEHAQISYMGVAK